MLSVLRGFRYERLRCLMSLCAMFALFAMGTAQAAHTHRTDAAHHSDTHAECLLCLQADGLAAAPDVPRPVVFGIAWSVPVATLREQFQFGQRCESYRARGPPQV